MKKIGIDMRLYSQTGVGVYLRNLLHELLPILPDDSKLVVFVLPQDAGLLPHDPHLEIRVAPFKWHTLEEQWGFLRLVNKEQLDLMHFTYFGYPILYRRKFIATIHDITPLLFRTGKASTRNPLVYRLKYLVFRQILKTQVQNACAIITPTHTVKDQLVSYFGRKHEEKIVPVYEGVNHELVVSQEDPNLYRRYTKPFLLYVGNFYPHKNIGRLIAAFEQIESSVPLLLVGPDDFFAKRLKDLIKKNSRPLNVFFHHNPSLSELHFFYKHAIAFVHPTLSEGFGLPLMEAAYFNLPVIASNIPVIRELLGTNYTPFDPNDTADMTAKMNMGIAHPAKPDYHEILSKFSFGNMAHKTLDLYLRNV